MFYWFIYLYMANKKIKEKIKEKENQYVCTKRNALSEQNNDTVTMAELSSRTVT